MAFAGMILRGALGVAGLGLRGAWWAGKTGVTQGVKAVPSVARATTDIGLFAVRHPYLMAGMAGAGVYAAMGTPSSPHTSPTLAEAEMGLAINQEIAAAEAMNAGIAPMGGVTPGAVIRNQRLMESTMGLTQGLHHSRH
jgi:hypothetical protein